MSQFSLSSPSTFSVAPRTPYIRPKAEIRLAETVTEGQKRGQIASRSHGGRNLGPRDAGAEPATLKEIGVDDRRLSEARAIAANVTPERIDAMVAEANERGQTLSRGVSDARAPFR